MPLNIKDPKAEALAAKVAELAGENKTEAIRNALSERLERLQRQGSRGGRLLRFLEQEAWPLLPESLLGKGITKREREAILGYGKGGV